MEENLKNANDNIVVNTVGHLLVMIFLQYTLGSNATFSSNAGLLNVP